MTDKKAEKPKPIHRQKSTWMGAAMVVLAIAAGVTKRVDPMTASAMAVSGFAVVFLRASIADAQAIALEILAISKQLPKVFLLALALTGCVCNHPDRVPTLKVVDRFLVKAGQDYADPDTRVRGYTDDNNDQVKASRGAVIKSLRTTIKTAIGTGDK